MTQPAQITELPQMTQLVPAAQLPQFQWANFLKGPNQLK